MENPILKHRQEVQNRILKAFDADDIEKAPLIRKKSIWRKSHLSGKYYRDYNIKEIIDGRDKMIKNGLIITQNVRENHPLLTYTPKMRDELKKKISSWGTTIHNNGTWYRSSSDDKSSYYLMFSKGNMEYEIRVSNHTKAAPDNSVIYEWNYHLNYEKQGNKMMVKEKWVLDASLGRLNAKDAFEAVKRMSELWKKFNSAKGINDIKKFAVKKGYTDFSATDIPEKASSLAQDYINDHQLEDDNVMTTYRALSVSTENVLNEILNSKIKSKKD